MKAQLCSALLSLMALAACGSKGPTSLEMTELTVTEGDKYNVIVRFKTAPEAYVVISVPKDEKTGEGGAEQIVKVKEDGVAQAEFLWGLIPNELNELDLRITHHQLFGVETKKKIPLNKKPKLLISGLLRTNPLSIKCLGRAFSLQEGPLHEEGITFSVNASRDTKIEFGGSSFTSTGGPDDKMKLDLTRYLVSAKLKDLPGIENTFEMKVPITVSFPDGVILEDVVVFPKERALKVILPLLSGIIKGPVAIPGEPPAAGGRSMVYLERLPAHSLTHFGADETFGELDLIAIQTDLPERIKPCGQYKGAGTTGTFGVSFYDTNIKIYDRRSGKQLKEKTFTAPSMACPSSINAQASGSSMSSTVKFELIRDFMKSAL